MSLKIEDSAGKVIAELKDDYSEPEMKVEVKKKTDDDTEEVNEETEE